MLNRVQLIGRLGADPDLRRTSEHSIARLSVATDRHSKAAGTDWHRVTAFDKTAELCAEFLRKGRLIHVEGRIQYSKYTAESGEEKWSTEIIAERVTFLDKPAEQGRSDGPPDREPGEDRGEESPRPRPPLSETDADRDSRIKRQNRFQR